MAILSAGQKETVLKNSFNVKIIKRKEIHKKQFKVNTRPLMHFLCEAHSMMVLFTIILVVVLRRRKAEDNHAIPVSSKCFK